MILLHSFRRVVRNPLRSTLTVVSLGLALGLLTSIVGFVDSSNRSMTDLSLTGLRVDMTAALTPGGDEAGVLASLSGQPGVAWSVPAWTAAPGSTLVGTTPDAWGAGGLLSITEGSAVDGSALVSEGLALSQGVRVGGKVAVKLSSGLTTTLPVAGIVDLSRADPVFATGVEAENARVVDAVFVDRATFLRLEGPSTAASPTRVLLGMDRRRLPADPGLAAAQAETWRRQLERARPGELQVKDALGTRLTVAAKDGVNAKVLLLFLGLPGVVLAWALGTQAGRPAQEARRRELDLLRLRGAPTRRARLSQGAEAFWLALAAAALGAVLARPAELLSWTTALTLAVGFVAAWATLVSGPRNARPWTERWNLDLVAVGASAVSFALAALSGGYQPTGNEGSAVSLSFFLFLGPLLAWLGGTGLVLRLSRGLLARYPGLLRSLGRKLGGTIGALGGRMLGRRWASLSPTAVLLGLTLAFGITLWAFDATYARQRAAEERALVGADVRVQPSVRKPLTDPETLRIPGVASVTPIYRDPKAPVGNETQALYGIDPSGFLATAFFPDPAGETRSLVQALAADPKGVLVNIDASKKFGIALGDPVRLRGQELHTVGFFRWLATSNFDSDFVVNRALFETATGISTPDSFLVRTEPGQAAEVSAILEKRWGRSAGGVVTNVDHPPRLDQSVLTSLSLGELTRLESIYVVALLLLGFTLSLVASARERHKEFAVLRALGARRGQWTSLVAVEALVVALMALILAVLGGLPLAQAEISLLAVLFTFAPGLIEVPWAALGGLGLALVFGAAVAVGVVSVFVGRVRVAEVLREE